MRSPGDTEIVGSPEEFRHDPPTPIPTRRGLYPPRMARLSIVMGTNETPYLGEGWMEREAPTQGPVYRACSGQAALLLPPGGALSLSLLLSAPPAKPNAPVTGRLAASGGDESRFELLSPFWSVRTVEIPASEQRRTLTIEADRTWRPSDLFHNVDGREIGFLVASLHGQATA